METMIVEKIRNNGLFSLMDLDGHSINKEYLIDIIKNLDFAVTEHAINVEEIFDAFVANLMEAWGVK